MNTEWMYHNINPLNVLAWMLLVAAAWSIIVGVRVVCKLVLATRDAKIVTSRLKAFIVKSTATDLPVGDVKRLVTLYSSLPEGERKVLDHIARRMLDVGLPAYGPMDIANDPRDMRTEEQDELYDACVYRALGNLRRESRES